MLQCRPRPSATDLCHERNQVKPVGPSTCRHTQRLSTVPLQADDPASAHSCGQYCRGLQCCHFCGLHNCPVLQEACSGAPTPLFTCQSAVCLVRPSKHPPKTLMPNTLALAPHGAAVSQVACCHRSRAAPSRIRLDSVHRHRLQQPVVREA